MQYANRGDETPGMVRDLLRALVEIGGLLVAAHRVSAGMRARKAAREAARLRRQLSNLDHAQRPAGDATPAPSVLDERSAGNVRLGSRRFAEETDP